MFSNQEVFLRLAVEQHVNSDNVTYTAKDLSNFDQKRTERRQKRTTFICEMLFSNP